MSEDLAAELERARRRQQEAGWSGPASAKARAGVHAAERALAASRSEPYAEVIDIGVRWDTGAPLPHVVSNGSRAVVICFAGDPDPSWDGTYTTAVSPADEHESAFGVIEFRGCASIRFGAPNDEALHGHPLFGRGLVYYQAHQIHNSAWLAEHIAVNSAHPRHFDEPWRRLHHYFLAFHDEMLEALAETVTGRLVRGNLPALLAQAARGVTSGG